MRKVQAATVVRARWARMTGIQPLSKLYTELLLTLYVVLQMMACAKKDAETMSKKEKKPATAKFQALNNVSSDHTQLSAHDSLVDLVLRSRLAQAHWH